MTELIITEKPQAALKIATALSDTKPIKKTRGKTVYYEIKRKDKKIYVGCAVGHLFGLAENKKNKWSDYPSFDISWKPKFEIDKSSKYTEQYLKVLRQLAKEADILIVATDYDAEGSVIGYTVVKYGLGRENAKRMKFSTLTKEELMDSYKNVKESLDFGMINAGIARHNLDWFYGINLTKALSTSIKVSQGYFRVLSTGRVQGPTLRIIEDREKRIKSFVPVKYWEVFLDGICNKNKILAKHSLDKIPTKEKVKRILKKTKDKDSVIEKIKKRTISQSPPTPFDLTTLQTESFKHLNLSPKDTSQFAQSLYMDGLISYPRTSSQKLPSSINYSKILKMLSKNKEYSLSCKSLLVLKNLKPNEGKKSDPAHPAIYPTGESLSLSGKKSQLYDLIVRRFLAVFGKPAKRETVSVDINVNKEIFNLNGITTVEQGWHTLYGKYAKFKEEELPKMKEGDKVDITKIYDEEKETQPPKRYTQASIIKELEKRNLGTKATRANILETLYERNYLQNQPIEITELGEKLIKTLEKYSPEIIEDELTSKFEKEMQEIREGKLEKEKVIERAKKILTKILKNFKKHEIEIGKELSDASKQTQQKANEVGNCQICKKGTLRILYSRKSKKRFVACDEYPKCKTTYSLPQQGLIKNSEKLCKHDNFPQVLVIRKGKRPWILCLNPECPTKEEWKKLNSNKS